MMSVSKISKFIIKIKCRYMVTAFVSMAMMARLVIVEMLFIKPIIFFKAK